MKITMIGCGKMGGAIAQRLAKDHEIILFDRHPGRSKTLAASIGGSSASNAAEAISQAEIVILAVKPQDLEEVAKATHREFLDQQLLVSILSGTTTEALQDAFAEIPILRMMPNLAVLHGQGVVGLADTDSLSPKLKSKAETTFAKLGTIHWIPEAQFDALTALTGAGPAFLFVIMESIIDAGIAMGFTAEDAKGLMFQLFSGSLSMIKDSGKHPGELKWQVASPSGTTIAGLLALEDHAVRSGIINTFLAAYYRTIEFHETSK